MLRDSSSRRMKMSKTGTKAHPKNPTMSTSASSQKRSHDLIQLSQRRSFPFHTFNFFPLTSLLDVAFASFVFFYQQYEWIRKHGKKFVVIQWKQPLDSLNRRNYEHDRRICLGHSLDLYQSLPHQCWHFAQEVFLFSDFATFERETFTQRSKSLVLR